MGSRSRHTAQEEDAFCLLEINVLWCEKCKSIPEQGTGALHERDGFMRMGNCGDILKQILKTSVKAWSQMGLPNGQ